MGEAFGQYIRALRLERGIGLREFCLRIAVDPSNYSKLERGLLSPPDEGRLAALELARDVEPGSEQSRELRRLAALGCGSIPPAVLSDQQLAGKLPLFFRTLEGGPVDEDKLEEVIAMIRQAWTHDAQGSVQV